MSKKLLIGHTFKEAIMFLWNYIKQSMLKHPSQTISDGNIVLSFKKMVDIVEKGSASLTGEKVCAIICNTELMTGLGVLMCFSAGVTAVPLSSKYGPKHIMKILRSCDPSCLLTDYAGEFGLYHIVDTKPHLPKNKPALIMWTSGTTGTPKGAMLSETNIISNVNDILDYFRIDDRDCILISRPLYHCAVLIGEFIVSLVNGVRIIIKSDPFNPVNIISAIKENNVTVFGGTPTMLDILAKISHKKNTTLKHIVISGECMSEAVGAALRLAFPKVRIYHVYGLTEACPRVSYMPPEYFFVAPDRVGVPLKSVRIQIRDDNNRPAKSGKIGILWVTGPNIMIGYYKNKELTNQKIKSGWLCTGDLALIDSHGWLKIVGRNDDLIIRAGMNIYPQEIEAELKKDPRVKEVLAYGYKTQHMTTEIGLKLVGDFADASEIKKVCLKMLPEYQQPSRIELVNDLPKNGSGKIIRSLNNA